MAITSVMLPHHLAQSLDERHDKMPLAGQVKIDIYARWGRLALIGLMGGQGVDG